MRKGGRAFYRFGDQERPLRVRTIAVPFKTATGMARRTFTVYYTQHGPVVRKTGDRWVSVSLMQNPMNALIQSYTRTKARDYAEFRKIMELHTNSSNNTVFADASGNIAYFHSNYIPRRDTAFDWTTPVDGSNPATSYRGVLSFDEIPEPPESGDRLAVQLQQLALVGGGSGQSRSAMPFPATSRPAPRKRRVAGTPCGC